MCQICSVHLVIGFTSFYVLSRNLYFGFCLTTDILVVQSNNLVKTIYANNNILHVK